MLHVGSSCLKAEKAEAMPGLLAAHRADKLSEDQVDLVSPADVSVSDRLELPPPE